MVAHIHRHLRRLVHAASDTAAAANVTDTHLEDIAKFATGLTGVKQERNIIIRDALWWSLGIMGMIILTIRLVETFSMHFRRLIAMSRTAEQQLYWARNGSLWLPKLKKYLLYAPLWNKRHNLEIQLSSAFHMGTLPSRLHALLLSLFFISNGAYCAFLDYKDLENKYQVIAELRGRTGELAVINMIALIIFAGRNNPLITWLKISFDTYNLLHRWIGRIVVLETIAHTIAWAYVKHAATGWDGIWEMLANDPFIKYGMVGTIAMTLLLLLSPSVFRKAFYETFLTVHIILASITIAGIWIHCEVAGLPQLPYVQVIIALWVGDRCFRLFRILRANYSRKGWTTATVEALPGNAVRVTMHLPKHLDIKAGTHAYLRFGSINPWETHPFSIAWVQDHSIDLPMDEKVKEGPVDKSKLRTDVSFVIAAQSGLTKKLFDKASACSPRMLTLKAAMEGPYAGHHSLDSYGTTVLVAGSSGITHQMPYIRHLINGFNDGTIATRRITLIWIVRDIEQLEWVRPWMDEILRMDNRREILNIKLFITRPRNPREIHSPSTTVQMFPGRPDVSMLLRSEVNNQVGAMVVTVCGPGGLQDNVREAVREVQELGVVDFIEESFTW
ncbi:ferric reductase [Phlyctema vagabunda]|uniref:Ferric reductase n=1 Tax=Phlyctema vagabunda TaxID=108571 RepID=A0ABR4PTQ4_9HELO